MTQDNRTPSASPRQRQIHSLKTLQPFFDHVARLEKTFEFRKDDRDFQVGDLLRLELWDKSSGYGGWYLHRQISYVLRGADLPPEIGLPDGYVVLGIEPTTGAWG